MAIEAHYEIGYYICCVTCEAQGPIGETYEGALEKWENRILYAEITRL